MKILKRSLAIISAIVIGTAGLVVISNEIKIALPVSAETVSESNELTGGILKYKEKSDGTLMVTGCMSSLTSVNIPSEFNGKMVTAIGTQAFTSAKALMSITIPDTVTHIYPHAFAGCKLLTDITIPRSVVAIYDHVFAGTQWLKDRQAENPLVVVNKLLIDGTTASGDVVIPDSVKYIGYSAFSVAGPEHGINGPGSQITSVTIPSSVQSICPTAFLYCSKLEKVTMAEGVEYIGPYAFQDCTSLTNIEIPSSICDIKGGAFDGTPWLKTKQEENPLVIVNNMLIDGAAASGDVVIPKNVEAIVSYAFRGKSANTELTSLTLPKNVKELHGGALYGCTALEKVVIQNPDCDIHEDDGITIPIDVDIHGYKGSTAYSYARKNGNKFVAIQEVKGDLNNDGELTLSDIVTMQKLLSGRDTTIENMDGLDMNNDKAINVFDLIILKRQYISMLSE